MRKQSLLHRVSGRFLCRFIVLFIVFPLPDGLLNRLMNSFSTINVQRREGNFVYQKSPPPPSNMDLRLAVYELILSNLA